MNAVTITLSGEDARALQAELDLWLSQEPVVEVFRKKLSDGIGYASERDARDRRDRINAAEAEAKKQALLDADIPQTTTAKCQVGVWAGWHTTRCTKTAKWRRPNFDKRGDLLLCGTHRRTRVPSRYTER